MTSADRPLIFLSHDSADGEATRLLQQDLDRRFLGAVRSRPTKLLVYRIVIPKDLRAYPVDPVVVRFGHTFADEETYIRTNESVYSVREEDVDGVPCWVLQLTRENPPYRAGYRLRWRLPSRQELATG